MKLTLQHQSSVSISFLTIIGCIPFAMSFFSVRAAVNLEVELVILEELVVLKQRIPRLCLFIYLLHSSISALKLR